MDWQLTCRVCLESGDMVSLFDWDENNEQLGDKYTYCCGVEVTKNDSLPTLICLNCVDRLTYAYQFKQQCLSSNDTLKECLQEFTKSSAAVSGNRASTASETETITIKQENGLLLQYELPVEHDPQAEWTRTLMKTPSTSVVTKAPGPRKRGRPRKYPNEQGQIDVSPYQRKKPKPSQPEHESITTLLASGTMDMKEEPGEDEPFENEAYDDPDFEPAPEDNVESEPEMKKEVFDKPRVNKPDSKGKSYKKYDENIIEAAITAYKNSKMSLKAVAEKFNINKSVLYRHSTKTMKKQGGQTVLTEETEEYLVKYIRVCVDWGYPLDALDLRYLIKNYLDKMGRTVSRFKDNFPGPDFVKSFLKRHKNVISERNCQNIKRNRAGISPTAIKDYFNELSTSLADIPVGNILNYSETNLTDDPGCKKIITKCGTKYPERVMNHSKASISVMMSATADGVLLPPYVVYKAQNLYDTWTENGPLGTRYNCSPSGWLDANLFEDWINTIVLPYFNDKKGKKCLIGDNLSSHLTLDVIKLCHEKNISFVFLPSNSTHLTQPLDIAFLRLMKIAWCNILLKWKKTDGETQSSVPKECFPKLLKNLVKELSANSKDNIIAGFRKTGINPIDPNQVLSRLHEEPELEKNKDFIDKSVLDILKEMRHGKIDISNKERKLDVTPERSVGSNEEYVETEEDSKIQRGN